MKSNKIENKKINNKKETKNKKIKKKVLVAMSGGVDSSVAACLLKDEGYEVAGVFLHFWKDEKGGNTSENSCCSLDSLLDAKAVAAKIGIPLYTFDYSNEFKKEVVDNFLSEYDSGRTPNPCVVCNRKIKIGKLLKQARSLGYDYLATGHYLSTERKNGKTILVKGKDKRKDQSYFLYTFTPDELNHLLFPLGSYRKPQVRKMARDYNLSIASKSESQDICFLSGDHNNFLKKYLSLKPGNIILKENAEIIGRHQGLQLYTIGQRRGLVGGTGPYYVSGFDYDKNILYVVNKWDELSLYSKKFVVENVNWLSGKELKRKLKCSVVIRYGHKAVTCYVYPGKNGNCLVEFARLQRAVTPGQSAVFYNDKQVLGGGIISSNY
ncbi:MAG: tRNA 2-thiouridine(34) synthase MnmA [Patescibacteria group bacterium]|jgi:tRNA-specific 2-thiouridylase|nr:tRNA 2-thiouridine(34) synthase MnmA [Patescibacteria group bacterium]